MLRHCQETSAESVRQPMTGVGVVVLYEDIHTALRARQSVERVLPGVGAVNDGLSRLWNIGLLRDSLLREQAAIEAAAADIIIVSLHRIGNVRPEFWDWMRRWQDHRAGTPSALGVLLDTLPPRDEEEAIVACVRRLAEAGGADFYLGACPASAPPRGAPPWFPMSPGYRAIDHLPVPTHWGINE
jgi:hypothetical protein